jgi:hypothetical protein
MVAGSALTIWAADHEPAEPFCRVVVPLSFGAGLRSARARWQAEAENCLKAGGLVGSPPAPDVGARTPELLLALDNRMPVAWQSSANAEALSLVCDNSRSTKRPGCTEASVGDAITNWIRDRRPGTAGATVLLFLVGSDRAGAERALAVTLPKGGSPAAELVMLLQLRARAQALIAKVAPGGSALVETLDVAAREMRDAAAAGGRRIVLLSDMMQQSRDFSFRSHIPAPAQFVRALASRSALPDLQGTEVIASGLSHATRGASSSRRARAVELAWQAALTQAGAPTVHIGTSSLGSGS